MQFNVVVFIYLKPELGITENTGGSVIDLIEKVFVFNKYNVFSDEYRKPISTHVLSPDC